jgi:transcription-repair coupling factor (superfamily II helicase)
LILDSFRRLLEESPLARRLPLPGQALRAGPFPGASLTALAACLADARRDLVVIVADTPAGAEEIVADLAALHPTLRAEYFPQREALPHEDVDPHVEIAGQRIEALASLLSGEARLIVTTSRALVERTLLPGAGPLELHLATGDARCLEELAGRLESMGFDRVHTVSELGEFAVRGGIIDLYPLSTEGPIRLELWDDRIASVRRFDPLTQRTSEILEAVDVLPIQLGAGEDGEDDARDEPPVPDAPRREAGGRRRSLAELLPEGALLFELDALRGRERRAELWRETAASRPSGGDRPAETLLLPPEEAESRIASLARYEVSQEAEEPNALQTGIEAPPAIDRDMGRLVQAIRTARDRGDEVAILCDNEGQLERLEEILSERGGRHLAARAGLTLGSLSGGFRLPGARALLVLTDHEIFRRSRRPRRSGRFQGAATLESVASLEPGDYVVHLDHGIGRYRGLERVEVGGEAIETLKIEYADGELLRVPHYRLDLIERWSAPGEDGQPAEPPAVHKLGGKRWKKLKQRTVDSIQEQAAELLELYAHRRIAGGHGFSPESRWQREMESAFLYEETPDQLAAWEEVRRDMEEPRPMDRLICGDVGYGKTEVAMRAAFKAVQDGKQVALLAPTTVLVEQHLDTFGQRLASFPVRVEQLSRFQARAAQQAVLSGVASGTVDILVGTHRLLSQDVTFRDLGLVIVDEEQRFGVRQKERLKALKRSVDVLTLTATPIPRTMQLALGGLRDMSIIETAPRDRMPIITHVLRWSDAVLQDAMRRELDRGGQVFFVHDRVQTIDTVRQRVRSLLPDARVGVAHGQMRGDELERTMAGLVHGDIDVLVCTSIIENGLDVPTANTMVVHRSDRFGLAQLYQLRGRVGRSHHRAYCYLLVPDDVTPEAERRLRILEHHTELGAGHLIALKDLELRGSGNLLGAEQSGFARAVGFETYRRLLERTVARLKGEDGTGGSEPTQVSVAGEAYLPDAYILDVEQKMHLYRRVSRITSREEVAELREELRDRFGPVPDPANRLLASVELRALGRAIDAEWIRVSDAAARINFRPDAVPRMALLRDAFLDRQLSVEVRRTQPLSLVLENAGAEPILSTMVDALSVLARTEETGSTSALASR